MLIDSHCHLDFPDFAADLDDVVARARAAQVRGMLTISTRLSAFEDARALAHRYHDVWCSVGIHPHHVESEGVPETDDILARTVDPRVIGIGETGLDYHYENSPRAAQKESFRRHIAASRRSGLPLIVHTRGADEDTMAILEDEAGKGAFPGLIHCFSVSRELARRSIALGLSISVSGIATFRNAQALRDTIAGLPLERLLVETDAPFLAPVPRRGKRNEPAFVRHTAALVAELQGIEEDRLANVTTGNFFNLFSKADAVSH